MIFFLIFVTKKFEFCLFVCLFDGFAMKAKKGTRMEAGSHEPWRGL